MFGGFKMSERTLGLLLFGGVVGLTVSRNTGVLRRFNWMSSIYTQKDRDGSTGEFVLRKSNRKFTDNKWRNFASSQASEEAALRCEIEVKNEMGEVLIFCWIMPSGKLCNFHPIQDGSIKDGSVPKGHVECAYTHHAFVCLKRSKRNPKCLSDVSEEDFVFVYKPTMAEFRHIITISKSSRHEIKAHITCKKMKIKGSNGVIDTSNKIYIPRKIAGFTCHLEPGVLEKTKNLLETLEEDLSMLNCLLPCKACQLLQNSTPIWINTSITYGDVDSPVVDDSMCFHPTNGKDWLSSMGMKVEKAGGIEIYSAQNYLKTRNNWGVGGLLLHEYSHAYHYKHCANGYDNENILEAYNEAMTKKLYDCVPVHGVQGLKGSTKAYACYNCMEFFAELSVAFFWQNDNPKKMMESTSNSNSNLISISNDKNIVDENFIPTCEIEYNKWYPHNYMQLFHHDINSCKILALMWNVDQKKIPHTQKKIPNSQTVLNIPMNSMVTTNDLFYTNN